MGHAIDTGTYALPALANQDRRRNRRIGHMNVGKAVLSIRHDDARNDNDNTIFTIEQTRGLVSTWAVPASFVGTTGHLTLADLQNRLLWGHEIACHSDTHPTLADPNLFNYQTEIVAARAKLEAFDPSIRAELFVSPGSVSGLFTSDDQWEMLRGIAARNTYLAATGFSYSNHYWKSMSEYYGGSARDMETTNVATLEAELDQAVANQGVLMWSCHTYNLDQGGNLTTAQYTTVMDYVLSLVNAGKLEVLTVTGALMATPWGEWDDIIREGNFADLPYPSSTWGPWIPSGSPTLNVGGPSGGKFVRVNSTNFLGQTHFFPDQSDYEGAHLMLRWKSRNPGGSASGPKVTIQNGANPTLWQVQTSPGVDADDGNWHTHWRCVTVPPGLDDINVTLNSSGAGNVDFGDVELRRI